MMEFKWLMKMLGLTLVIILAMQIRIGERTVESHAQAFVYSSTVTAPLNQAAHGAVKLSKDVYNRIASYFSDTPKNKKEEKRASSFRWSHEIKPANSGSQD